MSGPFHSLSIAGSGMDVYQTWIDAVADNIANINTVVATDEPAFRQRMVVARAREEDRPAGAVVDRIVLGDDTGDLVYQPDHALADDEGFVRIPSTNLSQQMTHLLVAQRAYQANVSAFRAARDAYQRALQIGVR